MRKQIASVSPLQTAKVFAIIYFVLAIPMVILMSLPMLFTGAPGLPMMMLVGMPFLYAIFGFLFTLLGAWVYNMIAAQVGGIEFTTVEID